MKIFFISLSLIFSLAGFSQSKSGEYTINILTENSANSDFGPSFYNTDNIIFSSARGGAFARKWSNNQPFLDLYIGTIGANGQISNITNLSTKLDSKNHESNVSFTPDNKVVYFTRNNVRSEENAKVIEVQDDSPTRTRRKRGEKTKLVKQNKTTYLSIYRADVSYEGDWSNIAPLPFNSKNYSVGHPCVNRDGTKLYFTSDMPGSYGMSDIFVVDINKDGTYSKPKNLGKKINTFGKEMFPFIDKNNVLYFASDSRKGGFGGLDIYAIKIYEKNYSDVVHLNAPMNTDSDDFALIINNDNNEGYFSSNREDGIGDDDIYHFVSDPPIQFGCTQVVSGVITDDKNKKLGDVVISVLDTNGKEIANSLSKANGKYSIKVPCGSTLKFSGSKLGYSDDEKDLVTNNNAKEKATLNLQLAEIVVCKQNVKLTVEDVRTSKPIPFAEVTVYEKNGKKLFTKKASKKGKLSFEVLCEKEFRIAGTAKKYDDDEMMMVSKTGGLSQKETLKMKLTPDLTEVKILKNKVVVNVNPIYFPLNSANITPTSAIELDKVVEIMRKYPKLKIEGGSHTDSRGGADFNLNLSYKRANSTVTYIINQGINPTRITARGYGETQPVNKCIDGVHCTSKEYQLNRRTEFVILNPEVLGYF